MFANPNSKKAEKELGLAELCERTWLVLWAVFFGEERLMKFYGGFFLIAFIDMDLLIALELRKTTHLKMLI